jgi:two-component system OmpR family sensor kinase
MNEQYVRTQIAEQRLLVPAQPTIELGPNQPAEEFIAILAHDLRNYIASVHGYFALLHQSTQHKWQELDRQLAGNAKQTLEQMDKLIANVLDTVRMQRGFFDLMLQPVDLVPLIRNCADLLQTDSHPIELDLPPTARVHGDEERLRQALHNLLTNAIQHSPSGTPVKLSLTVETQLDAKWMVLTMSNRGAVIPPDLLPRIFEPFAAGPHSTGLGLGLYLVRGIALAHGGILTVRSAAGSGTCFELVLPSE